MKFIADIRILPKEELQDYEGHLLYSKLNQALPNLIGVRKGKHLQLEMEGDDLDQVADAVEHICEDFLINKVSETFTLEVYPKEEEENEEEPDNIPESPKQDDHVATTAATITKIVDEYLEDNIG